MLTSLIFHFLVDKMEIIIFRSAMMAWRMVKSLKGTYISLSHNSHSGRVVLLNWKDTKNHLFYPSYIEDEEIQLLHFYLFYFMERKTIGTMVQEPWWEYMILIVSNYLQCKLNMILEEMCIVQLDQVKKIVQLDQVI